MKLTIEQISILAANNVKLICLDDDRRQFDDKIKSIDYTYKQIETNEGCTYDLDNFGIDVFFVLHNLSDLTKEIEHNGEKFIPIERIAEIIGGKINAKDKRIIGRAVKALNYEILIGKVQYIIIKKLHEWHFDTENLIENNLAINKNEL